MDENIVHDKCFESAIFELLSPLDIIFTTADKEEEEIFKLMVPLFRTGIPRRRSTKVIPIAFFAKIMKKNKGSRRKRNIAQWLSAFKKTVLSSQASDHGSKQSMDPYTFKMVKYYWSG
jgi:hypothetical protein